MEQVALGVPDIHSRECERAVASALINIPGVQWASASASPSGVVGVRFDPHQTELSEIREAVEAAGFKSSH